MTRVIRYKPNQKADGEWGFCGKCEEMVYDTKFCVVCGNKLKD